MGHVFYGMDCDDRTPVFTLLRVSRSTCHANVGNADQTRVTSNVIPDFSLPYFDFHRGCSIRTIIVYLNRVAQRTSLARLDCPHNIKFVVWHVPRDRHDAARDGNATGTAVQMTSRNRFVRI